MTLVTYHITIHISFLGEVVAVWYASFRCEKGVKVIATLLASLEKKSERHKTDALLRISVLSYGYNYFNDKH